MFEQKINLGPGTGTFADHTLEILLMLTGAFLLGLLLGWVLWNRYKQAADKLNLEIHSLRMGETALRSELDTLRTNFSTLQTSENALNEELRTLHDSNHGLREHLARLEQELRDSEALRRRLETELSISQAATETGSPKNEVSFEYEQPITDQPSGFVDGEVLNVEVPTPLTPINDVPDDLQTEANPDAENDNKRQGKGSVGEAEMPILIAAAVDDDDLTIIEGIGPKISMLLHQYGIRTYRQLAETEVLRLKEILSNAGPQLAMHNPGTWPSQANLAANGEWDTLKSLQEFLKGGKAPK
jgi:predicted flap endonuclease-1-like 5' DNA nuclease